MVLAVFAILIMVALGGLVNQFTASIQNSAPEELPMIDSATAASTAPSPAEAAPTTAAPTTAGATAPAAVPIVAGAVYDPEGDGTPDYKDYVDRAFDGNEGSFWLTWVYKQQFPTLKSGVGLALELERAVSPTQVTVKSATNGTVIEVRTADSLKPGPVDSTTKLGWAMVNDGVATVDISNAPSSKYLIVYVVRWVRRRTTSSSPRSTRSPSPGADTGNIGAPWALSGLQTRVPPRARPIIVQQPSTGGRRVGRTGRYRCRSLREGDVVNQFVSIPGVQAAVTPAADGGTASADGDRVHDVIVVGSGPAGYTAAIYLARAELKPLVFEGYTYGGALMNTTEVENFPGFPAGIMGPELMAQMREQAERFGADLRTEDAEAVDLSGPIKTVTVDGSVHRARSVILATGSAARYIGLPDEQRLVGRGVSACATCDGFFFRDQDILVVGRG